MKKEYKLKAKKRDPKKNSNMNDVIFGNIYAPNFENINLSIKKQDFEKIYEQAGESNLIDLEIEGMDPFKILIKEIQKDAVKNRIIHVDFYKVDMTKEINTEIPLEFVGVSKAEKELGGMLIKNYDSIEVECLPGDLVDHIDVDISKLENIDDSIRMEDLDIPKGMKLVSETNDTIVSVTEIKEELEKPEEEKLTEEEEKKGDEAEGNKEGEKGSDQSEEKK